jgi:hypothetical protein
MQCLLKEIIIMIMVRLPAKASNLARPRAVKLRLKELITLGSTCTLFNIMVKTIKWKKNIIFKDNKIFLQNQSVSNLSNEQNIKMDLVESEKKENDYILKICIRQTRTFKQIIENISEIVQENSIVFSHQNKETDGMCMLYLTENNNVLLKLILFARHFEYFECNPTFFYISFLQSKNGYKKH